MSDTTWHHHTKTGTLAGTLLALLGNIHREDVLKTVVLAAIGAAVSFSISFLLNLVRRKVSAYFRRNLP